MATDPRRTRSPQEPGDAALHQRDAVEALPLVVDRIGR